MTSSRGRSAGTSSSPTPSDPGSSNGLLTRPEFPSRLRLRCRTKGQNVWHDDARAVRDPQAHRLWCAADPGADEVGQGSAAGGRDRRVVPGEEAKGRTKRGLGRCRWARTGLETKGVRGTTGTSAPDSRPRLCLMRARVLGVNHLNTKEKGRRSALLLR
jgi:hypothetical protein